MTLFAYRLLVTIWAVIWEEEKRGGLPFFSAFVVMKKKKKQIPRLKFLATFTHTNISVCTHARPISFSPSWRHVQGSRDHPECFALHCLAVPFSALEGGERLFFAKRWVRPFHCQHPSFTQASVSQGNSLSCPPACVCISEYVCVRVYMCVCVCVCLCVCVCVCEEECKWKGNMKGKSRLDDSLPNLLQFPLHD